MTVTIAAAVAAFIIAELVVAITLGWWLGGRRRSIPAWARELEDRAGDLALALDEMRGRIG